MTQSREQNYNQFKSCSWCGEEFIASRVHAKFCSASCRSAHHRAEETFRRKAEKLNELLLWMKEEGTLHGGLTKALETMIQARNQATYITDDLNAKMEIWKARNPRLPGIDENT